MEDIRVSIDAYTLDRTVGKKKVYSIDQDGSLVYEAEKPPGADFSSELERIWTEYPEGLLDLTEAQLEALPQDEDAVLVVAEGEVEKEERDPSQMMSAEDMEALRSEVFLQLNDARNELWYVLELAKTLASSSEFTSDPPPMPNQPPTQKKRKPEAPPLQSGTEPPILPPGTFSTTASSTTLHPAANAYELEIALSAKQQALEECSALIDGAVEELQAMAEAGDRFWGSIRELRDGKDGRGQWAILPRPDFGRNMADGERAKDVIIPYAMDEAPPALHARSLAAFDLNPTKIDSLTFGARSHLRLRVTLQDEAGLQSSSLASSPDADDVRALMSFVQDEAFDEDLFNELRAEAMRSTGSTVEPKRIVSSLGEEEVVFELYDIRNPPPVTSTSRKADLILQLAHLSLLRLHRYRKNQVITQSSRLSPNFAPGPPILSPILQGLRYQRITQKSLRTLGMFMTCMQHAGIKGTVETSWKAAEGGLDTWDTNSGNILDLFGGKVRLKLDGMPGITLITSAIKPLLLRTVKASFPLTDPDDLPSYLSEELAKQLLAYAETSIHRNLDERLQDRVFLDDLAGVVTLPDACLSISILPPYSRIEARLEPYDTSLPVDQYDVSEGGLDDWLRRIAQRVKQ